MIYTENTKKALSFCFKAHKRQKDKSGMPYVFHPFLLAEHMEDETTTIVALLHDVVEDTRYTLNHIKKLGFSDDVLDALSLLNHQKGVDYMDYVKKIKENPIATKVKLADLKHNSDITRLNTVDEKALKRREKYLQAIEFLNN
ncbi:MAG: HD domain-containing protein [Clostridiales bacterium]|nr:HD domain-containing protein [Clostridiales bacterium]